MTKSTTDLKKDLEVQERTVKLRELLEKKWKELPNNIGVGRFYIKLKPDDFEDTQSSTSGPMSRKHSETH